MKTTISAQRVIFYAFFVELGLLIIQFLYMKIYQPGVEWVFTDMYMQNAGFFIFQILGFFCFILLARYVFLNSGDFVFRNAILLFFVGAAVEILFYVIVQAQYQGAFLYSVLDKIVAIAFGLITTFASTRNREKAGI